MSWDEHYGVDALITRIIHNARTDITKRGRAEYAAQIRAWRKQSGMTLRQLARARSSHPFKLGGEQWVSFSTPREKGTVRSVADS